MFPKHQTYLRVPRAPSLPRPHQNLEVSPSARRPTGELVPGARIPVEPAQQLQVPPLGGERTHVLGDPGAPLLPREPQEVRAAPEASYCRAQVLAVPGQAALKARPELGGRGVRRDPARGGRARRPGLPKRSRHGGEEEELLARHVLRQEGEDIRVGHGGAWGLAAAAAAAFLSFASSGLFGVCVKKETTDDVGAGGGESWGRKLSGLQQQ